MLWSFGEGIVIPQYSSEVPSSPFVVDVLQQVLRHTYPADISLGVRTNENPASPRVLEHVSGVRRCIRELNEVLTFGVDRLEDNHLHGRNLNNRFLSQIVSPFIYACAASNCGTCKSKTIGGRISSIFSNRLKQVTAYFWTRHALLWINKHSIVNSNTWTKKSSTRALSDVVLSCCDSDLLIHDVGLTLIGTQLEPCHNQQGNGQASSNIVRGLKVPNRLITWWGAAIGWLILWGWVWYRLIALGHSTHLSRLTPIIYCASIASMFVGIGGSYTLLTLSITSENASASVGPACVSAPTYGGSEDVRVVPIVVPEFEFRNIERQIFAADLVIGPDHAALDERPEAFNRIGVDRSNDVLANGMIHGLVRETALQPLISGVGVCAEQAHAIGNGLTDEGFKREPIGVLDNAGDHIAFALDRADDWRLARVTATARSAFFIPMPVLVATAYVAFINLDDPDQLTELRVLKASAYAMRHVEGCSVRADPHDALDLEGTDALFGGQHHMDDAKPGPQSDICVLKDRSDQHREAITASLGAPRALPMEWPVSDRVDLIVVTARAADAFGPAPINQIRLASVVSREPRLELRDGHLFGKLGHLEQSLA